MSVKKRVKKTVDLLADKVTKGERSPLANNEQKRLSHKKEIEDALERFQKECSEGFRIMMQEASTILTGLEKEKFAREMEVLLQKVDTEEKLESYLRSLGEGKTWREVLSLSDFFMNSLYRVAVTFFNEGKYQEAISSFASLAWLDNKKYIYLVALGFSLCYALRYEEALYAYLAAAPYAPDTCLFLYLADCYEKIGKRDKARLCIESGLAEEKAASVPHKERLEIFQKKYHELSKETA